MSKTLLKLLHEQALDALTPELAQNLHPDEWTPLAQIGEFSVEVQALSEPTPAFAGFVGLFIIETRMDWKVPLREVPPVEVDGKLNNPRSRDCFDSVCEALERLLDPGFVNGQVLDEFGKLLSVSQMLSSVYEDEN